MKLPFVLTLCAVAAWPLVTRAEHAQIDLRVIRLDPGTGENSEETMASADEEPPASGVNPRPLVRAHAHEPLVLQFILTNAYPHGDKKDVTVRYLVAREDSPRQKVLPDLAKGTVTQGRFTMNFKPKCRVGARVAFTIKEPGLYLVRVETGNTNSDHEHFSAIDLAVE